MRDTTPSLIQHLLMAIFYDQNLGTLTLRKEGSRLCLLWCSPRSIDDRQEVSSTMSLAAFAAAFTGVTPHSKARPCVLHVFGTISIMAGVVSAVCV